MSFALEPSHLSPQDPIPSWLSSAWQELLDQREQATAEASQLRQQITLKDENLKVSQLKIQALTLELARYRRLQFGQKTEAFTAEQQELFDETFASDIAAIETDIAQQADTFPATTKRPRAGRQPLPDI